jgi:hypothetical protein
MLKLLAKLFGSKPTVNPCSDAPYKVEPPAQASTPVAEKATQAAVESINTTPKKKAPAKKPAAPKKETASKRVRKPKAQ